MGLLLNVARRVFGIVVVFTVANVRELIFLMGLLSVTAGLALVSIPAALIVPGLIFMWLAIPPRQKVESK